MHSEEKEPATRRYDCWFS